MSSKIKLISGLVGLCIGDALGVPVEFTNRAERQKLPVTTMIGYGTWNVPAGTWSDDSSLTLCLAESLCNGFSLNAIALQDLLGVIAKSFWLWYDTAYWSAHNEVFDIGNTTLQALEKWNSGVKPLECGGKAETNNGNGSLMRILPMAFLHKKLDFDDLISRTHQVSCITHAHLRSQIACGIYIAIAVSLLEGNNLKTAYEKGLQKIMNIYEDRKYKQELSHFNRILKGNIGELSIDDIYSDGYVVHTLESSLWCLLNSSSYSQAVLKAVNLGGDTDTTAAVTGGLAGIHYGVDEIPQEWLETIARKDDIVDLGRRFAQSIDSSN